MIFQHRGEFSWVWIREAPWAQWPKGGLALGGLTAAAEKFVLVV